MTPADAQEWDNSQKWAFPGLVCCGFLPANHHTTVKLFVVQMPLARALLSDSLSNQMWFAITNKQATEKQNARNL
jgi:hypothetical protein